MGIGLGVRQGRSCGLRPLGDLQAGITSDPTSSCQYLADARLLA
jgi:hypothetical protein